MQNINLTNGTHDWLRLCSFYVHPITCMCNGWHIVRRRFCHSLTHSGVSSIQPNMDKNSIYGHKSISACVFKKFFRCKQDTGFCRKRLILCPRFYVQNAYTVMERVSTVLNGSTDRGPIDCSETNTTNWQSCKSLKIELQGFLLFRTLMQMLDHYLSN